jgi:hypothetical protein
MATSNALVSCVTDFDEKFRLLMTSISTHVFFFTKANLYCWNNFWSMKYTDALESIFVWASIVTNLLHLIVIGTKNVVMDLKITWDHLHYMMHQNSTSWSLLRLDMLIYIYFLSGVGNKGGACFMLTMLIWIFTINMTWFFTIQTKIVCMSMLIFLLCGGFELCLIDLHGVINW